MATGDANDIISRLQRWLPTRWFPSAVGTRIYATLAGGASALSAVYTQITYARQQTRLTTSTDGFLDLASFDYLGDELPRLMGESDPAYAARIQANLFLDASTPSAIEAAVENVTGYPARLIEPWNPSNTFCWGKSFWGVNTKVNPGQWSNGNQRYVGFVVCSLPASSQTTGRRFGWGNFFWAQGVATAPGSLTAWPFFGGADPYVDLAQASGAWWTSFSGSNTINLIYAALNRVKVKATAIFVQIVPPGSI